MLASTLFVSLFGETKSSEHLLCILLFHQAKSSEKGFVLLFLATFSILSFRSIIFPMFPCTYLKTVVWLDKIKWSIFFCLLSPRETVLSEMGSFQTSSTWSTEFNRPQPLSNNLNQALTIPTLGALQDIKVGSKVEQMVI